MGETPMPRGGVWRSAAATDMMTSRVSGPPKGRHAFRRTTIRLSGQRPGDPRIGGCALTGPPPMDSILPTTESPWPGPQQRLTRPMAPIIYLLGVLGGLAGGLAAIYQELMQGQLLTAALIGPAIEEACKPIGVLLILARRPHWLRNRGEVIGMAVMGALIFATLENLLYVHLYHTEGGTDFVVFRYTVCTALHVVATTVLAVGLAKLWRRMHTEGIGFDIDRCMWYYVAAIAIHSAYNITVTILSALGMLEF